MLLFIALLIRERNRSNKSAVFCENFMLLTFFNIIVQDLLNKKEIKKYLYAVIKSKGSDFSKPREFKTNF